MLTILLLLALLAGVYYYYQTFLAPNMDIIAYEPGQDIRVIMDNQVLNQAEFSQQIAQVEDGVVYLSYDFISTVFDPYLFWDEEAKLLILSNVNQIIELPTNQLTAFINQEPVSIELGARLINDSPYLALDFLAPYYQIVSSYHAETRTLDIRTANYPQQKAKPAVDISYLRQEANIKEPIVKELLMSDTIYILADKGHWYHARTEDGIYGYIPKNDVILAGIDIYIAQEKAKHKPIWKPLGGKINLTWEQVYSANPKLADMPAMPGLNVISPTWFHLKDIEGNVNGRMASSEFVEWAHERDIQVWALYSNNFDPAMTSDFLKDSEARKRSIRQLISYAEMFDLDGINIDFENVYYKDSEFLTQYIRELAVYLHEAGLVVSIDVTFLSINPDWSMVYDRAAFAEVVDYVMVMAYDEHWASSPTAGSVASLPWVENGLGRILELVPHDKLVLGVPFYTRIWKEEELEDGKIQVSSKAVSMAVAQRTIADQKAQIVYDDKSGQNYAEYIEGNNRYRIWLEDEISVASRAELVKKYDLAGIASWSRNFEEPETWEIIEKVLSKRP